MPEAVVVIDDFEALDEERSFRTRSFDTEHERFIVFQRNLYTPRDWVPAKPWNRKDGNQHKVPRHQLVGTEYWVVEVNNVAILSASILGEPVSVNRINSRNIVHKHKIGFVWAHDIEASSHHWDYMRRAIIMADWIKRCGFWPFDI